ARAGGKVEARRSSDEKAANEQRNAVNDMRDRSSDRYACNYGLSDWQRRQSRGRGLRSRHLQPAHGAGGGGESVGLQPHALQHRDEEVRQRIVVGGIECEMLAVLEPAAGE